MIHPIPITQAARRLLIAKNTNTFLKKKREQDKKAKAEEKRARRIERRKRAAEGVTDDADDEQPGVEGN